MKLATLFKIVPGGTLKNQLRCAFYNARTKRHGLRMAYRQGRFLVQYQGVEAVFVENPYYKGVAQVAGYFQEFGIKQGDIVVDAGACQGDFALIASKLTGDEGKVIAFEPDADNAAILEANIKANDAGNVAVIKKGLWSEDTTLRFRGGQGQYSALCREGEDEETAGSVDVVALDNELHRLGIDRVDFVKADIEGAEIEFIEGARRILEKSDARLAIASYHVVDGQQSWHRVTRLLDELGYDAHSGFPSHLITYGTKKAPR